MAELTEQELGLLGETFLFRGAPGEALMEAVGDGRCRLVQVDKGEPVYTPESFDRALGVLLSGRIRVEKGELIVSVLEPGDLFGAAALFNDLPGYAARLTARAPCRAVLFPEGLVAGLLARYPALSANYIRYQAGRIRFLEGKIDALTAAGPVRKLSRYLREHARGDTVELDCPLTGLAARLGVGRTSLYRALDALTAAGAIEHSGRTIRILDRSWLA